MKKNLILLISVSLVFFVLFSCKPKENEPATQTQTPVAESPAAPGEEGAGEGVKTGLAVITSIAKSKDVSDEDGLAQIDSTIVAVIVDRDGKIMHCRIDAAQTKINFSFEGKITTRLETVFRSKQELGGEYGMEKASSIKKEWFEQANALANYVIGKTIDEVKGIAVNEQGAPTDAELASSVTVSIGDYIKTIEKAVASAKELGANVDDKLGLGIITKIDKSKDAAEEDGVAQASSYYVATTFDESAKITSCVMDGSNSNVAFSRDGKIISDLNEKPKTKNELGAGYGMAKVSSIGREWFEQADALSKYVVGKTASEVHGIAVNEGGAPTDAELASSVTISIADFVEAIQKSVSNAK